MITRRVRMELGNEWIVHLEFWCPGCRDIHGVPVSASTGPAGFCWNGKMSKPTIWPPVVIDSKSTLSGCVFTITDGVMKFAEWCTHEYAGKEYAEDYDWINPPRATKEAALTIGDKPVVELLRVEIDGRTIYEKSPPDNKDATDTSGEYEQLIADTCSPQEAQRRIDKANEILGATGQLKMEF